MFICHEKIRHVRGLSRKLWPKNPHADTLVPSCNNQIITPINLILGYHPQRNSWIILNNFTIDTSKLSTKCLQHVFLCKKTNLYYSLNIYGTWFLWIILTFFHIIACFRILLQFYYINRLIKYADYHGIQTIFVNSKNIERGKLAVRTVRGSTRSRRRNY